MEKSIGVIYYSAHIMAHKSTWKICWRLNVKLKELSPKPCWTKPLHI